MTAAAQSLSRALRTGWTWWTGELAGLLPFDRRAPGHDATPGIVVSGDAASLSLIDERVRPRGARKGGAEHSGKEAWDVLTGIAQSRSQSRSPVPVRLRLPYSACFVRRVELPGAVRDDAARILDLDLERATPFRLKDVYTAHFVDEARSTRGTLGFVQLIVRRDTVDKAAAEIRLAGVELAAIDCWNEDGTAALPVDFLSRDRGAVPGASPSPHVSRVLTALAAMLAASAVYLAISRHEAALAELTAQTGAARIKVAAVRQSLDKSEQAQKEIRVLQSLRSERPRAVAVLDGLTRLLPDSVWISDFRLEGDTIEFSGEAKSAAPLVSLLEHSEVFSDAAFSAPVTREGRGDKERFSMRAHLRNASAAKAPSDGGAAP